MSFDNNFLLSIDDPTKQMAANIVGNMVAGEANKLLADNKGYLSWFTLDGVKDYFDVTNEYVLRKLCVVIFPFTVKGEDGWKRQINMNYDFPNSGENPDARATPRNDLQAPDLYIPLMAHITFIILCGAV